MSGPNFSWDFNFGHVLTTVSICGSLLGGGLIAYTHVDRQLTTHESRIAALERSVDQSAIEQRQFQQQNLTVLMEIRDRLGRLEGTVSHQVGTGR